MMVLLLIHVVAKPHKVPKMRCERQLKKASGIAEDRRRALLLEEKEEPFVLFFIHVFKAAGSSVRTLLRRYAEKCGKRWVCLVTCTEGGNTKNGIVQCRLRDLVHLNRENVFARPPGRSKLRFNPSAELLGMQSDVIGGHYYYGMHRILPPDRKYTYFTVLREPVATWISGIRYHDKSLKTPVHVSRALAAAIPPDTTRRKYANAMTYMVPAAHAKGQPVAHKLELARYNLKHGIAIVGLVESWPVTVALLQAILDMQHAVPTMWQKALQVERNTAKTKFSGQDVLHRLPPHTFKEAAAFLSAENELYADAVLAHATACFNLIPTTQNNHLNCPFYQSAHTLMLHLNSTLYRPDLLPSRLGSELFTLFSSHQQQRVDDSVRATHQEYNRLNSQQEQKVVKSAIHHRVLNHTTTSLLTNKMMEKPSFPRRRRRFAAPNNNNNF